MEHIIAKELSQPPLIRAIGMLAVLVGFVLLFDIPEIGVFVLLFSIPFLYPSDLGKLM